MSDWGWFFVCVAWVGCVAILTSAWENVQMAKIRAGKDAAFWNRGNPPQGGSGTATARLPPQSGLGVTKAKSSDDSPIRGQ